MYYFFKIILYLPIKFLCWTKIVNKKNMPKKGSKLIISCNHQSAWDILILSTCLPYKVHFLAKKELYKNKFLTWLLNSVGAIQVDRENMSLDSMKKIFKLLKNNKVIGIFPEGTRNKSEEPILPFKEGIELIAMKTKTPILITAISRFPKTFKRNKLIIGELYNCKKDINNLKELEDKTKQLIAEGENK